MSLGLAPVSRRWAFQMWRRSRPFWGGLLLLLAGLEMLAIPLLSVLAHTSVKVIIYIGIGGVFGVLIGGLLVTCGLLIWFHPSQRAFYAIAGVLLAVVSFVATNLGGFFVGMLLGVTGGSLSFAWAPVVGREPPARRHRRPHHDAPSDGLGIVLRDQAGGRAARGDHRRNGDRLMALAVTPLVLSGLVLPGSLGSPMRPASPQSICIIPIPFICPAPSPTPSPGAQLGRPPAAGQALPAHRAAGHRAAHPHGDRHAGSGRQRPGPAHRAAGRQRLAERHGPAEGRGPRAARGGRPVQPDGRLGAARRLSYDGVAHGGDGERDRDDDEVHHELAHPDRRHRPDRQRRRGTAVTRSSSMHFAGPVVLYATKLSGDLLGIPVTLTPTSPLATILQLLAPVTRAVPVPMTHVVTDQPYTTASSLQAGGLEIGA